jgi:Subtilase family
LFVQYPFSRLIPKPFHTAMRPYYSLIVLFPAILLVGCEKPCPNSNNKTTSIIIYKDNISQADIDTLKSLGLTKTLVCPCDSNLQLWGDTTGVPIYGNDGLANNGDSKPGGASGSRIRAEILPTLGFEVSPNYIVQSPDVTDDSIKDIILAPVNPSEGNLIGVMDTGLASNNYWNNENDPKSNDAIDNDRNGLVNDYQGWNFVDGNNQVTNTTHPHGTMVTYLLERELKGRSYGIVPMVVLDRSKEGKLFNLICAMAYSIKIPNLKTLNASLGYYGPKSSILAKFIGKLKEKNIMLVVAAGNTDPADCCENVVNPRDLDARKYKFYPASHSKDFSNVISATTVYSLREGISIAPNQNFSKNYIDVGVMGDKNQYFEFKAKVGPSQDWGSSYAAPIAAAFSFIGQTPPLSLRNQKNLILSTTPVIITGQYKYQKVANPIKSSIRSGLLVKQ